MNALRALLLGFLFPATYRAACHVWRGTGFVLVLLLVLVGTVALGLRIHAGVDAFCRDELPGIVRQIPEIHVENGTASTPEERRHIVTEPRTGQVLAIIDTGAESIPPDLGGAKIFVGRHGLAVRRNDFEQRTYSFADVETFTLDEAFLDKVTAIARQWTAWIAAPFVFLGLLLVRGVQWLFFSLPILLYMRSRDLDLGYPPALRLSALAMTPVVLADLVLSAMSRSVPFAGWAFLAAVVLIGFAGVEFARARPAGSGPPPPALSARAGRLPVRAGRRGGVSGRRRRGVRSARRAGEFFSARDFSLTRHTKQSIYKTMNVISLYKCLCDRTRLRILNLLGAGPLCVCHLMEILECDQVRMSKQLRYMRELGLVEGRRHAQWMVYRLAEPRSALLDENLKCLQDCAGEDLAFAEDSRRRAAVMARIAEDPACCPLELAGGRRIA